MIIESILIANLLMLATKGIYTKVIDKHAIYSKIINEGLYHVTTEENALKILESGTLNPSNNFLSLGGKKAFFFAGIPSYMDLCTNTAEHINNYSFKAVKIKIKYEELAQFKCRSFNDDSIIYEGKYQLPKDRVSIEELVFDLDKDKKIIVREKVLNENYNPKENKELLKVLNNGLMATTKNLLKSYINEYKMLGSSIKKIAIYANNVLLKKKNWKLYHDSNHLNYVLSEQASSEQEFHRSR